MLEKLYPFTLNAAHATFKSYLDKYTHRREITDSSGKAGFR